VKSATYLFAIVVAYKITKWSNMDATGASGVVFIAVAGVLCLVITTVFKKGE
jgi:hypothetical protein